MSTKKPDFQFKTLAELEYFLVEKRTISLFDEVGRYSAEEFINKLDYLNYKSKAPIQFVICSPGGSVDAGLAMYDAIKASKAPVYTRCVGFAASMGAILLASGKKGKRSAAPNSRIMIHQPSSGFAGKATDIEIHAAETSRIKKLLNVLISEDTGKKIKDVTLDTEKDYWMTALESLKYGLVDKVE